MHHKKIKTKISRFLSVLDWQAAARLAGFLFIRLALGRTWPYLGRAP
jgi:hypothetical protein